jgi:hypothetical protein
MTDEPVGAAPPTPPEAAAPPPDPSPPPAADPPADAGDPADSPFDQPRMEVITASLGPPDPANELNLSQDAKANAGDGNAHDAPRGEGD